jgi:hypothetical protein
MAPLQASGLFQGISKMDALVFEFMGLAVAGLCVIVLVTPATRRPSHRRAPDA